MKLCGVVVTVMNFEARGCEFEPQHKPFYLFFSFFRFFKLAITLFRENSGTKSLHKRLHISLEKLGISMNRACPRVLTFLIGYLVKSVDDFHWGLPHCAPYYYILTINQGMI